MKIFFIEWNFTSLSFLRSTAGSTRVRSRSSAPSASSGSPTPDPTASTSTTGSPTASPTGNEETHNDPQAHEQALLLEKSSIFSRQRVHPEKEDKVYYKGVLPIP